MSTTIPHEQLNDRFKKATKKALLILPVYILVPVLFMSAFYAAGYAPDWKAFGLGALGWFVALLLRGPVSALVAKLPEEKGRNILALSSGPLEESVRLLLVAFTSVAASSAGIVAAGQGWAAIEVLFTIVNIVALTTLANKTDEKAMEAKKFLAAQGQLNVSPLWGVIERIWASAFHIGATMIVAFNPWTVIILIPLHSGLNWFAVRFLNQSFLKSNMFVAIVGVITFIVGLLVL